jgi:Dynein heavy chain, N-terminal region 2
MPRFYFVSDPTLLEILSLGSDPPLVVPHFQSGLFDSLAAVTFDKGDKYKIIEMISQQGESVELEVPVDAMGIKCSSLFSYLVSDHFCCQYHLIAATLRRTR